MVIVKRMKRPSVHHSLKVAFVFGVCWIALACFRLAHWAGYKRTEAVVEAVHPAFKEQGQIRYNTNAVLMRGTKPVLALPFMRSSGSLSGIQESSLPAGAKQGDRVSILYRPDGRDELVYSFNAVWRVPMFAGIIGAVCICLGLWFRSRPQTMFTMHQ